MSLLISDDLLKQSKLSEEELKMEIAILLYKQERITLGQGSEFLGISQWEFQSMLADREIPVHYGIEDLYDDLNTLDKLNI